MEIKFNILNITKYKQITYYDLIFNFQIVIQNKLSYLREESRRFKISNNTSDEFGFSVCESSSDSELL